MTEEEFRTQVKSEQSTQDEALSGLEIAISNYVKAYHFEKMNLFVEFKCKIGHITITLSEIKYEN